MLSINLLITYLTIIISTIIMQTNPTPHAQTWPEFYYWYSQPCAASEKQEDDMQLAGLCKGSAFALELGQSLSRRKAEKQG